MRELRDGDYYRGRYRTPPDDEDWTRQWLRRLGVACEGEQLQPALASLDSAQWARMKAAWRNHKKRRKDGEHYSDLWATRKKRLGPLWRRCIALGLVSEADAIAMAQNMDDGGYTAGGIAWGDAGCRLTISLATAQMAAACREADRPKDLARAREIVAGAARLAAISDTTVDAMLEQLARETGGLPSDDLLAEARRLENV